ncbi:hypothetical protein [Rhizobium sp. Leaf262]|uniref:hypothetical protein n=1 Tax=Rhizobium sp. Leaf262 TaxID=1736312 RepID=UPI000713F58D|nr:hypothetical protein [Rhizobium sp. Leaf262]KQO79735.1 hypothetical protein ASF29_22000 [Rhizobium sp. Leaf262]
MTIIFPLIAKFPIIALVCGLLVSAAFGKIVGENLERGINFNRFAAVLICINLALLGSASSFSCATSGSFCLPGVDSDDALVQWLAVPGFYAFFVGLFIVPMSAFILSTYAFGWIYWIVGGRKRHTSAKN